MLYLQTNCIIFAHTNYLIILFSSDQRIFERFPKCFFDWLLVPSCKSFLKEVVQFGLKVANETNLVSDQCNKCFITLALLLLSHVLEVFFKSLLLMKTFHNTSYPTSL